MKSAREVNPFNTIGGPGRTNTQKGSSPSLSLQKNCARAMFA